MPKRSVELPRGSENTMIVPFGSPSVRTIDIRPSCPASPPRRLQPRDTRLGRPLILLCTINFALGSALLVGLDLLI
jgi:hypothetical protein